MTSISDIAPLNRKPPPNCRPPPPPQQQQQKPVTLSSFESYFSNDSTENELENINRSPK